MIVAGVGVTVMLETTCGGAVTVNWVFDDPLPLPVVTVTPMVVVPAATVVATPVAGSIVATAVLLLVHAADVIGAFEPPDVAEAVKFTVMPTAAEGALGEIVTVTPVSGGLTGDELFRGAGAAFAKSTPLSLVS